MIEEEEISKKSHYRRNRVRHAMMLICYAAISSVLFVLYGGESANGSIVARVFHIVLHNLLYA